MSAYTRSLRILAVCSLLIAASASAQQAAREEPTCASDEIIVNHRCVPRNPNHPFPPAEQTGEENPPVAAPRPDHPTIPRCKEGEELRDSKCVPKT